MPAQKPAQYAIRPPTRPDRRARRAAEIGVRLYSGPADRRRDGKPMTSGMAEQDPGRWIAELDQEVGRLAAEGVQVRARVDAAVIGTDPSGAVTIRLGRDAVASRIHVAADWRQRLKPEHLGAAIVAADSD